MKLELMYTKCNPSTIISFHGMSVVGGRPLNDTTSGSRWLSNFAPTKFVIDGHQFVSSEQAFMYYKAVTFGDTVQMNNILKMTKDPIVVEVYDQAREDIMNNLRTSDALKKFQKRMSAIKSFGRKVTPFDPQIWYNKSVTVMCKVIKAKFLQDKVAQSYIIGTGDAILAEAASRDTKWGTGKGWKATESSRDGWRGDNLLGYELLYIREYLNNK